MRYCQSLTSLLGTLQLPLLGRCAYPTSGNHSNDAPLGQTVTLEGYGTFTGTTVNSSYSGYELPTAVDAWLGIAYAEQPTGARRFTEVSWPPAFEGVRPATAYGPACIQDAKGAPGVPQDEACLSFNVYRTPGVPLSEKLPVLVWIHGGAFVQGSWRSFDGAAFAASAPAPLVVVSFHYRINSLGFLPSALFEAEGLLNLGLRDQYFFLRHFVQQHIGAFGGDAAAVTIGGRSAGGHSVGFHYYHNYGADAGRPYFAAAIHQSGAVTSRAFPDAHYPLYAKQFANFTVSVGCDEAEPADAILACLRAADINEIRTASTRLFADSEYDVTWPFQPTRGGPLLERAGSRSSAEGTFFRVPVLTSNTDDEGKYFVAGDLESDTEFRNYMHIGSPALTPADLDELARLYPDPATDPASPYAGSPNSTQYNRLAAAWSDYAYICPGQETAVRSALAGAAGNASGTAPVWKLRFSTNDTFPAWKGIPHTADTKYTWDERAAVQHPDVSPIYHGYLSSFVATGDPNKLRHPGSPYWPRYAVSGDDWTAKPGRQLVVQDGNRTRVEWDEIRTEQCRFWRDPERAGRLNK